MNNIFFGVQFSTDEKSCRLHFKEQRDKEGVLFAMRCQGSQHYWLQDTGVPNVNPVIHGPPLRSG